MADLTVITARLAWAAALVVRALSPRATSANTSAVLLTVHTDALDLTGTDGHVTVRVTLPCTGYETGCVLVSRRNLAATVAALDAAEIRLTAEGSRLAIRTPNARFALPLLDQSALPALDDLPATAGTIDGKNLHATAIAVAGAAAQSDALPIFTGVRLRGRNEGLSMVATDRFRMAAAAPPWSPTGEIDVLVPAGFLADTVKLAGATAVVTLHADAHQFAIAWPGVSVRCAALAQPYPDEQVQQLFLAEPEATATIDARSLAAAVARATLYSGSQGRVSLHLGDGIVVIRGGDEQAGESEETIKATVRGGHCTATYNAGYLADALQGFTSSAVTMQIQAGIRPTVFSDPSGDDPTRLRYLIVPLRLP
ncbi:DNA polymerase III subunit beta [Rhizocola hellebori]|uniref:DNA polymerase III subunit beta n=1 Tax=Rhizocola hellebori TaxID=1392758 RepID=A0A8J3QF70_9ACTN|nr:DNA polymerase III subunit beta [Rhizocola hellebori]GIH08480.1 DNA polymerase III subunit beta [Rhizocola hellebori]